MYNEDCEGCEFKNDCSTNINYYDMFAPVCPCRICIIKVNCSKDCDEFINTLENTKNRYLRRNVICKKKNSQYSLG